MSGSRPPSLLRRLSMREPKDVVPLIVKTVRENPQIMESSRSNSIPKETRSRYVIENKSDISNMKNFFMKVGLSVHRAAACAEKSVLLNIHTPRRLFYYVQSVPSFSLTNLGMDKYDADMVLEDLVKAYGASNPLVIGRGSSVSTNDASKRARRMTPSEIPVSKLMDSIVEITESEDEQEGGRRTVRTSTNRSQRDKSKTRRSVSKNGRMKAPTDEEDIIAIQDFFRFSGLGQKLSRRCAEKSILMQTHSPKKLYRSIVMEKIKLTDLGMDEIDAMMVQEALHKTFYDESISMIVSQKEKENVGLKSTSRDVDNNIEKKGSGSGSEIINETIESININSIVKIDEKINYLSAFKQKKILRSEERENELESPDSQQSDISSPNTFDNLGDSLNQIMSQSFMQPPSDYDHFMAELSTVMLHPDRTRKSKSIYSSSHHSAGVSNVLAGLPSRPSSVITVKIKASSIPTDLLLSRVASVLKRNDSNGFRKQMR